MICIRGSFAAVFLFKKINAALLLCQWPVFLIPRSIFHRQGNCFCALQSRFEGKDDPLNARCFQVRALNVYEIYLFFYFSRILAALIILPNRFLLLVLLFTFNRFIICQRFLTCLFLFSLFLFSLCLFRYISLLLLFGFFFRSTLFQINRVFCLYSGFRRQCHFRRNAGYNHCSKQ